MSTTERITAVRRQLVHRQGGKYAHVAARPWATTCTSPASGRSAPVEDLPLVSAGNMVATHLTFYSLPDALPFLVRLTMMVATQVVVGKALQRPER